MLSVITRKGIKSALKYVNFKNKRMFGAKEQRAK